MLQEIQHRDDDIDHQLDEIGVALQDLNQIAQQQGQEVLYQSEMLDRVQKKTNKNQGKLAKLLNRFRS